MRKLSRRKFIGSSSALAAAGLGLPGQSVLAQPQADLRGAAPDYVVINARVFTSDPENPREVGFLDTVPWNEEVTFDGSWSNYPYFESGTIVVTSMAEGVFLAKYRPLDLVP